nr:hypothetical protein [Tanacetum cinerariifolium]
MNPWGGNAAGYGEAQNRVRNELALNVDNVFQAEDCDAFDSDVDEAPTAQTMFMANLSSADPITDEAGPSYDSDILSEVHDHDYYLDDTCAYQEEHVMHDSVQLDHVVDPHADHACVSNMISYDHYVKDNKVSVVHSNASSVPNDTFMMIYDDMCEPFAPSVSNSSRHAVVKNSLTAEMATYREQVELYERQAKFKLTERKQKINEKLKLLISDRNFKEEILKRELHSIKLQLTSTINRNKSMVEESTFLKQNFKQKENKLLADFLNMKLLKEKVEDRLVKQDQSLQTVHMLRRPRPLYNDLNKVAIGYKNPLCLTRAKQAQYALYNGNEILKDNHARAKVHKSEDTLEIAEITRKKMNAKMTDPECVTHKVKIAPHDYSKENLLATFTPQKQLTPEQIYWSNNLMKLKSKAFKEWAKVSRPIKAFTVITPSAITDGERGFKQTKACYLQEVIPFFQTIKDNFEGIQKALTREVKKMKDVFEELEAEVSQCPVDRKHDAIDQKNLLIANDNLITECLSKEVFSVATESELNVARFAKMHVANTSVEARCLALEAELATLRAKSHQENQGDLIKHFSKLEVDHLNLLLKYQNLKDSIGNHPPTPDKDTPDFDFVFVIDKMQASLQGKDNVIRQLKKQISKLQMTNSDTECTDKVRTTDSQLNKVTDPVTNLQAQNDRFRAKNNKVKQHYKQLYDSIKITRAKHIEQVTKLTAENVTLKTSVSKAKVQPSVLTRTKHAVDVELIVPRLRNNRDAHLDYRRHLKESVETIRDIIEEAKKTNVPVPHSTGVKRCPKAGGSQPKSNHKTNRILPAKSDNKLPVEDLPRTNKSHLKTTNRVDSNSRLERSIINSNLDSICQTCNKCLTSFDHDMCVAVCVKSVALPHATHHNGEIKQKIKQVWKPKHVARKITQVWKPKQVGKVWRPTGKVLTTIGHQWRPTGRIFHLGTLCPLTRFTPPQVVSATQHKKQVVQIVLWYLDSGYSKHTMGDCSRLLNFVKKFIGTVRFGNDYFGAIMGYGDYVVGKSVISRVYYVKGLGHNLFSVGQFCDSDLEVAFKKHSCYVRDTNGVDLIKGSRGSNLYTISVEDMMKSSPICLLSKAFKNKSWLWHWRLNHLNFGTINDLARKDLV